MSLTLTLERGGGEVSGSGTNIELDGTIAGGAIESVEMYGDTEQQTYSGKNLFNISSYDGITQNADGTVKSTKYYTAATAVSLHLEASTRYTISIRNSSGELNGQGWGVAVNGTWINTTAGTGAVMTDANGDVTLTVGASSYGAIGDYNSFFQLEKGNQATSFEPYVGGTASPNPDYPQEVKTVTGEQTITISEGQGNEQEYKVGLTSKNLFDKNAATSGKIINRDTGTADTGADYTASDYIEVEEGQQYTFTSGLNRWYSAYYNSSKQYTGYPTNSQTITIPTGVKYIRVSAYTAQIDTAQFEKGSTATTYAPYFTPIELCKIGTYQDYIYKSGEDWYVHKEIGEFVANGSENWVQFNDGVSGWYAVAIGASEFGTNYVESNTSNTRCDYFLAYDTTVYAKTTPCYAINANQTYRLQFKLPSTTASSVAEFKAWFQTHNTTVYYALATPTDTQITNDALIAQLDALNEATTYDGTTVITVSSENLAGSLEVTASTNIAKTYTEVEIGSPFTITDVEGKSSNTTLDGNVYVDWAYNKKQYSFDLFNLTPQDYADIRAFYDYQFNNSAFPTITVPELNIDKLPVYMEISSRNIINQCLLTDKLTIKFRETVQP